MTLQLRQFLFETARLGFELAQNNRFWLLSGIGLDPPENAVDERAILLCRRPQLFADQLLHKTVPQRPACVTAHKLRRSGSSHQQCLCPWYVHEVVKGLPSRLLVGV
jgi:hypothetical protein